ncbi:TPA: antirestriction protein ArdA [Escherichia coli]|nr:antirestriction protein ArdA [Escherichia coli]HCB8192065.1 antirestriction protein ArdA [Escherichia coli]
MTTEITITAPSVYVGTYAKYNNGSIAGKWVNLLDDVTDCDDFYEKIAELHSDEADPEFMFQDYENMPRGIVSETSINWDYIDGLRRVLEENNEEWAEAYALFVENFHDTDVENFYESYSGTADSEADYAEQLLDDTGELNAIPKNLRYYFDYEKFARDLFINDYTFIDGHVFRNY